MSVESNRELAQLRRELDELKKLQTLQNERFRKGFGAAHDGIKEAHRRIDVVVEAVQILIAPRSSGG
jgi:chromosome segregation ATPase